MVSRGDTLCACPCQDLPSQAALAENFAMLAHNLHREAEDAMFRERQLQSFRNYDKKQKLNEVLPLRSRCFRVERDLWSLLSILTRADLLRDVNDAPFDEEILSALSPYASLNEVINTAYASSESMRKGKILKDWIESAASDQVTEVPPMGHPQRATLSRLLKNRPTEVKSLHPDAQLTKHGTMLSLEAPDNFEQESLLKSLWQLIRSGNIVRAQELAVEHSMFHLAASLLGVAYEYHDSQEDDQPEDEGLRRGNSRRVLWQRTCSRYADHLASSRPNWNHVIDSTHGDNYRETSGGMTAILEMSIYAALSNNLSVLSRSPLIRSWEDKLWMYVKAAHERDVSMVLMKFNTLRSAHSRLFSFCTPQALEIERELVQNCAKQVGSIELGSCAGIKLLLPPMSIEDSFPSVDNSSFGLMRTYAMEDDHTVDVLLLLQGAVMQGASALKEFINATLMPLVTSSRVSKHLARVFSHLVLWLYLSCSDQPHLRILVDDTVVDTAIGVYVDQLIIDHEVQEVATYASFLDKNLRIEKYIHWLNSLSLKTPVSTEADRADELIVILSSAKKFFRDDMLLILRGTVELSRTQTTRNTLIRSSLGKIEQLRTMTALVVHSSAANKSISPGPEDFDRSRLESLRLLSFDIDHRVVLVKQINAFIQQFLVESAGAKAHMVLLDDSPITRLTCSIVGSYLR